MVKGSVVWVSLDPARGAEVPKTRPCIVVSRTEANDVSSTVTIVPLSSVSGRAADRLVQPVLSARETCCPRTPGRFATKFARSTNDVFEERWGVLRAEFLARIDRGLILHLELEDYVTA